MFVCLDCEKLFEEPNNVYGEPLEHFGFPRQEEHSGCPHCEGACVETWECSECGEYINGCYIKTKSGDRICENCFSGFEIGDENQ